MLDSYLVPILTAFLTFPVAAMLCAIPILVMQYRKHGYFNKIRGILLYLFLLYLMNALYLVILPMPASRHNEPMSTYMQLIPLNFIQDIVKETRVVWTDPSTYVRIFKERAFLQVVFNIALVVPFGMFVRYYWRKGWKTCLIASFGLSLFFEVTQVTGIYGYYDYPYRLFDVDDLILNTLGGMIGYVIAEWAYKHLPRLDEQVDLSQKRVSYTRRAIAFIVDWSVLTPVILLLGLLHVPGAYFLATFVYFILVPYLKEGRTIGKAFVRIRITGQGEHLSLRKILIRNGLLYLLFGGLHALSLSLNFPGILEPMYFIGLFLLDAVVFIHVLICLLGRKQRLFHEEKSGTDHAIT